MEIFDAALSDPTAKMILSDTWPEEIDDPSENREDDKANPDTYNVSKLSMIEDEVYHLKKRLARFEGREGTVFFALDSMAKKLSNLTRVITPDRLQECTRDMDERILQQRMKEHAHDIEIRTLRTLVKKQNVRIKDLESQLEALKTANWNENNIWRENYESLEEELEETRTELHHLLIARGRNEGMGAGEYRTKENLHLDD